VTNYVLLCPQNKQDKDSRNLLLNKDDENTYSKYYLPVLTGIFQVKLD